MAGGGRVGAGAESQARIEQQVDGIRLGSRVPAWRLAGNVR